MQENSFDSTIQGAQNGVRLLHHPRSPKDSKVMQQECHDRIVRRKRLTLAQGMWLYNRYINSSSDTSSTRESHNYIVDELREARATILKLQRRIEQLEGAHRHP